MKITFDFEGKSKELYFEKSMSFHGTIDNQIKLCDIIISGLNGGDKSFLLNNQMVKKKELNVIEFSMNSILDDLKLTSKSYNLKIIQSLTSEETEEELTTNLNQLIEKYQEDLASCYEELIEDYGMIVKPTINIKSIKKLLLDNFSLVEKDELNLSKEIELQLLLILNYISLNKNQHFYLILKHFDHCLDSSQMTYFYEKIRKAENICCLIFSKSFELFEYERRHRYSNSFVDEGNVRSSQICEIEKHFMFYDLLTEKEQKELDNSVNLINRYKKYYKLTSENKKMVEKSII